jgi:hypothetical protein
MRLAFQSLAIAAFLSAAAFSAIGCSSAPVSNVSSDSAEAETTSEELARAFRQLSEHVGELDYLPLSYGRDGCYARSLYMSMELASIGIPSSAYYIVGDLHPSLPGVTWGWHVAPMMQTRADGVRWILDPSLFRSKGPVRVSEWIEATHPRGDYVWFYTPGSVYYTDAWRDLWEQTPMVRNFAELPVFYVNDIANACAVLYEYIGREKLDATTIAQKRSRMVRRTRELIPLLDDWEKLEYEPDFIYCGGAGQLNIDWSGANP